jgi:hypothetical protein
MLSKTHKFKRRVPESGDDRQGNAFSRRAECRVPSCHSDRETGDDDDREDGPSTNLLIYQGIKKRVYEALKSETAFSRIP